MLDAAVRGLQRASARPLFDAVMLGPPEDASVRAGMALWYTDVNIPRHAIISQVARLGDVDRAVDASWTAPIEHSRSASAYTLPLTGFDVFFSSALPQVTAAFAAGRTWREIVPQLDAVGFSSLYADYLAILSFYAFPTWSIPRVDAHVLAHRFRALYGLMAEAVETFLPGSIPLARPADDVRALVDVRLADRRPGPAMGVYLMQTDVLWTNVLYRGFEVALARFLPVSSFFLAVLREVRPRIDAFFALYAGGVRNLVARRPLSLAQWQVLATTWEMDALCYENWTTMHRDAGVLDAAGEAQMWTFHDNVLCAREALEAAPIAADLRRAASAFSPIPQR